MSQTLSLGLGHPIAIEAPLASMHKSDVVRLGLELGVPFGRIAEVIDAVLQQHVQGPATDLETVRAADRAARARATTFLD
jgi:1-deoxy-D-xylulose 5-phosphate reductoisomerase